MRIAWAASTSTSTSAPASPGGGHARVALAAGVLASAGVVLPVVANVLLATRLLPLLPRRRRRRRRSRRGGAGKRLVLASLVAVLVMIVVCSVHGALTPDEDARAKGRTVLRFAGVYLAVVAALPGLLLLLLLLMAMVAVAVAGPGKYPGEKMVEDRLSASASLWVRVGLVVFTSALLAVGAGFRAGVNFAVRPVDQPAWYHSRAAFYCFTFGIELLVVYTYAVARFDRLFSVQESGSAPQRDSGGVVENGFRSEAGGAASGLTEEKR